MVAVLGAVATLSHCSFAADSGEAKACNQEYHVVQDGLYTYMANYNLTIVPPSSGTNDMTRPVPLYNKTATAANPTYVRNSQTRWSYIWNIEGTITGIAAAPGGPSLPPGCLVG
ncbi:MAG TPA: hypothetical protein VHJ99_11675 [Candidatus Dormibacteraeota bacterium]|nr:hypothetical protein [Candidatus Dormibacteraeota bacterium]